YRVWLSEIMLQQTQVKTAAPYFERFVAALPDVPALAAASLDTVLGLWSGLGYYARARNLHAAAKFCVEHHGGDLPRELDALTALPGIGRSTAAAIASQAWGDRHAILDGNVKRVLSRYHGIDGYPGLPAVERQLWTLAESHLPHARMTDYTQAQMDLGATLCTRADPSCILCPLQHDCVARIEGRVAELPVPKPGKVPPQRYAQVLWLLDRDGRGLSGWTESKSKLSAGAGRLYFYARFDRPIKDGARLDRAKDRNRVSAWYGFDLSADPARQVSMRIATSLIGVEQAQRNLQLEIADSDSFDSVRERARAAWD
ncbi:hypothetical protein AB4084_13430, partial [Lysobacter sp. 2RAB21]